MPAPSDLVHQTSTTTGTGALTLTAVNGKRSFLTAFGTGGTDTFDYFISNRDAAEWERGTGHENAGTLVRDTVLASSNAGAAVNFSAGTKDVTNDIPAANQTRLDGANAFTANQTITSTNASALAVGRQGATDPVLKINAATASVATGIEIAGAAAAGRVALAAISSGTNEGLSIDAKGSGTIRFGATSTGAIEFSRNAVPTASDGAALGTTALMWSDAFFASGAVLNFNNGNQTLTHAAGALTLGGSSGGTLTINSSTTQDALKVIGTPASLAFYIWNQTADGDQWNFISNGTGTGSPYGVGSFEFYDGSSGNRALGLSDTGNCITGLGGSALATTATAGFLYIPTCAGTPTGTPAAYTGKVAMVFDTTNNELYVYDGGWISGAAFS